jgi:hypothetical protein
MLTFTGKDELVARQRQMDMVEQAQRANDKRASQTVELSLGSRWMFAFGEQLVNWGCRLQTRYQLVLPQRNVASRCDNTLASKVIPGHI